MTRVHHNALHHMHCLQGLPFGMNRVLHVFAKKKRRFAAAALASRSQMGILASAATVLLGPGRRRVSPEADITASCLTLLIQTFWIRSQIRP